MHWGADEGTENRCAGGSGGQAVRRGENAVGTTVGHGGDGGS